MKKITAFILMMAVMLTMAFSLTSCGEDEVIPDGMKYACNPDIVDYSLFVPESWIVDNTTGMSQAHVSESDRSSVTVGQWNITNSMHNYDTWWAEYKSQIEKLGEVEYISNAEDTTLGGADAKKYVYRITYAKGTTDECTFKYMIIATVTRGSVYVFQYAAPEAMHIAVNGSADPVFMKDLTYYDDNMEEIENIIEKFKFN